ncbi:hypothetical protein ANN_24249 [Periplaneta americana]|uniref:DUF4817 domain-containing protein n=1 Tax=Periplaneta americana TaxID=6978 RepID=A0ABQ8S2L6_PERAM|nr:hypothetical protein ANN_24249 [Periplaneta americana]
MRKIVFKVYYYFKNVDEQNAAGHLDAGCNVANMQETTVEACDVGLRTVQRILLAKERGRLRFIAKPDEQRGFAVKSYYLNGQCAQAAFRNFFLHFYLCRHDPVPFSHVIEIWIRNLEETGHIS